MIRDLRSLPIAAVAFTLLTCKGDKPAGQQPVGTAATTTVAPGTGVTDSEIVLGEPAAFSGPSAGLGIEMWRGATAAFDEANDAGGINGRKIRLVVADDAYDAEKAGPAALKLITQDHVFALFGGVGTPTIVRVLPIVRRYYDESGLFYFANFTGAQPQRSGPNAKAVFNVRASYYEEIGAMVEAFVASGRKKIGTFVQDDAYGTDGHEGAVRALKVHGLSVIAEARYPRGQQFDGSMASQVKILRDAGADAVVMVGAYEACAAFVRDARATGWNVPLHNVSFVGADQMLQLLVDSEKKTGKKLATNLIVTQVVPHYDDTSLPAVQRYRAAIDKYSPQAPAGVGGSSYHSAQKYSFGSLEGFLSARAFLMVLDKAGKDLTRQSFFKAAESMGPFDLGVGVPAELSATRHQVLDRVWFTYATPAGWKPTDKPTSTLL